MNWDGTLPIRRYAIFRNIFGQDYSIAIKGKDLATAEKWGGFVGWLGAVKPAGTRSVCRTTGKGHK